MPIGLLTTVAGTLLILPRFAYAQAASPEAPSGMRLLFTLIVLAGGAFLAAYWAKEAFERRELQLENIPTLPRYMTSRRQYMMGLWIFIGIATLAYLTIVVLYNDLLPLLGFVNPDLQGRLNEFAENGGNSYAAIIIVAAAVFLMLLKIEHPLNLILVVRNVIHSWVSIPGRCREIILQTRNNLRVPAQARQAMLRSEAYARNLSEADFSKERETLDRKWAECSYMMFWLRRHEASGHNTIFFAEPSLLWPELTRSYSDLTDQFANLKARSRPDDGRRSHEIFARIDDLHKRLARFVACFLVYENNDPVSLWRSAREFGIPGTPIVVNSTWSIFVYAAGVMVAIHVGVMLSSLVFDLLNGAGLGAAFDNLDPDTAFRWIWYGLATYCAPILVLLLGRYIGQRTNPCEAFRWHPAHYAAAFFIGMIVSTVALAAMVKIMGAGASQPGLVELLNRSIRWSVAPAIACVYVMHCLNSVREPLTMSRRLAVERLSAGLVMGVVLVTVVALPVAGIESVRPDSAWSLMKTRFVIIGTVFTLGFVLGTIAPFGRLEGGAQAVGRTRGAPARTVGAN